MHLANGSKRFLMQMNEGNAELASTDFQDKTSLATILQLFKEQIHLDVTAIELVELTNGNIGMQMFPYLFWNKEAAQTQQLPTGYAWEEPNIFRKIIEDYDIEGVPFSKMNRQMINHMTAAVFLYGNDFCKRWNISLTEAMKHGKFINVGKTPAGQIYFSKHWKVLDQIWNRWYYNWVAK